MVLEEDAPRGGDVGDCCPRRRRPKSSRGQGQGPVNGVVESWRDGQQFAPRHLLSPSLQLLGSYGHQIYAYHWLRPSLQDRSTDQQVGLQVVEAAYDLGRLIGFLS